MSQMFLVMVVILTLDEEYKLFEFSTMNNMACKMQIFLLIWPSYCSVWNLVAVTIERLIVIYFPHR